MITITMSVVLDHSSPRSGQVRRLLLSAGAGTGVAVVAGAVFAVTYDDLRALAVTGGAARHWAPAYPVMADGLIVVTVLALVAARGAHWWPRLLRWALLVLLLAGAAAASVERAVDGYGSLPDTPLRAGVAVAPYLLLALAIWLWLAMCRRLRGDPGRRWEPAEHYEPGGIEALLGGMPDDERAFEPRT